MSLKLWWSLQSDGLLVTAGGVPMLSSAAGYWEFNIASWNGSAVAGRVWRYGMLGQTRPLLQGTADSLAKACHIMLPCIEGPSTDRQIEYISVDCISLIVEKMITVHTTSCCACLHCGFLHPSIRSLCMLKCPLLNLKKFWNMSWSESASISHAIVACQEDTTNTALGTQGDFCKGNIVNSTLLNHQSRFFVKCVRHAPWDFERLGQIPARLHTAGPQDNETRTVCQDDCHRNRWSYCVARLQGVGVRAKNKLGQWLSTNWIFCATLRLSWFCKWGCVCVCRSVVFSCFFVIIAIRYQCCWML